MPYKDPEVKRAKQQEYSKKHYERNKNKIIKKSVANKKIARAQWQFFKKMLVCSECGQNHPATLDFHHAVKHPDNKRINQLTANGAYAAALEELKKCVVLCANCHRIHHYKETKNNLHKLHIHTNI